MVKGNLTVYRSKCLAQNGLIEVGLGRTDDGDLIRCLTLAPVPAKDEMYDKAASLMQSAFFLLEAAKCLLRAYGEGNDPGYGYDWSLLDRAVKQAEGTEPTGLSRRVGLKTKESEDV